MNHASTSIVNPFYAAAKPREPQYVVLPEAPLTASPVPELTSLYHDSDRGNYGDRRYPGNCSGKLIRALLRYFQPQDVYDPMTGSGTCRDVCRELQIPCDARDLHSGFDAADPLQVPRGQFDFCWIHPPYWRMKRYSNDARDLSTTPTLDAFLERYEMLLVNCADSLRRGGTLAVLMGDYSDRDAGFVPLTFHTKRIAFNIGLQQNDTDIVRFSHGASSSKKVYQSAFIPGLHDLCMLFQKG